MITIKNINDFNLDHIFDCGQCFRWEKEEDGSYTGTAYGNIANISYDEDNNVIIDGTGTEDFWREYLDLHTDYGAIKKQLEKKDQVVKKAIEYGQGIRILNQEKWETLVSFIISANNNIPRIKKNIEGLASNFGESIGSFRGKEYFNLPKPEVLATLTEEDLAPIKLGYRAGYLIKTAKKVEADKEISYENLSSYHGVGPKVANCISLFSMKRMESFPIDTWVEKVMEQLYGIKGNKKAMADFAKERFGEYGGIAQQYLFYYMKNQK